jgi:chromosome partitioning protein
MARVIAICNQKGGVGKSTSAINCSSFLALRGKYVLMVDTDPQANATIGIGLGADESHPNIYHCLVNDQNPSTMLKRTSMFGFDVLPANQDLAGATIELVSMEEREMRLKRVLDTLRTDYDYILIDCPPTLGILTLNSLVAAEKVIIPVQCEYYSLEGLSQLLKTIELVKENLNPDLQVLGVLLTMYDKRSQLNRQVMHEVINNFPGRVFDTVISRTISLAEAPSFGKSILQFDPGSKAANEYRRLVDEIISLTE